MTDEQIIKQALHVAGQLWVEYKKVPDPTGQGACGDIATRLWADHTSVPHKNVLGELQDAAGGYFSDRKAAWIVMDVSVLEGAILHYISRGGDEYIRQLNEAVLKVRKHMDHWKIPVPTLGGKPVPV